MKEDVKTIEFNEINIKDAVVKLQDGRNIRTSYYEAGSGFPLLFLHGLGASCDVWLPAIYILKRHFKCFAIDFPGHGHSQRAEDLTLYSNEAVQAIITAFTDQIIGADKYGFVGNSVGATLALMIAGQASERVSHVVAVSPAGIGKEVSLRLRLSTLPILGEILFSAPILKLGFKINTRHIEPHTYKSHLAVKLLQYFLIAGTSKAILYSLRQNATIRGATNPLLNSDILSKVECPVLIFWGDNDPIVPISHGALLQKMLPNSRLVVLSNAGHGSHLDQSIIFMKEVHNFYEYIIKTSH